MAKRLGESTHLLYSTGNQQVRDTQASLPKTRKWYGVVAAMICAGALVGTEWHVPQSESIVKDAQVSLRKQNEPVASATNDAYKAFYETTNSYINASADPCDDFYEYACGNWLATHELLPSDDEFIDISVHAVMEANNKIIQSIIDTKPPVLGEFYDACVHTTADTDKESAAYVANVIKRIHAENSTFALLSLAGELFHQSGLSSFLDVQVRPDPTNPGENLLTLAQGGYTLPSHNTYLEKDKEDQYAALYHKYIQDLIAVGDLDKHNASQYAANVLQTETAFAAISLPDSVVRNSAASTRYTLDEIRRQLPYVSAYLAGIGKHQPILDEPVVVTTPRFFEDQNAVLSSLHLDQLKNYLSFHVMDTFADTLGEYFRRVSHDFHSAVEGTGELKARPDFCVETTTTYLGPQLGEYYMAKVFNADAKAAAQTLINYIEEAMNRLLGQEKWLDEATLVAAREKLHNVRNYIGGPDKVAKLPFEIKSDSFFENVLKLKKLTASTKISNIGQPVDADSWDFLSASEVNAYYDPSSNKIVFPAAILQPPFYSATAFPPVANFGRVGTVMGHELTHGFDNTGREYDAKGVLRKWWTPVVSKEFEKRAQCLSEQYSKFAVVSEGQLIGTLDGNLTLGENIADNGGVHLAYEAYQVYKNTTGFSPGVSQEEDDRTFFLAYGQLWCEKRRVVYSEGLLHMAAHSPGNWRANGPLMNFDKFAETFQCAAGTRMNPTKKCVVW